MLCTCKASCCYAAYFLNGEVAVCTYDESVIKVVVSFVKRTGKVACIMIYIVYIIREFPTAVILVVEVVEGDGVVFTLNCVKSGIGFIAPEVTVGDYGESTNIIDVIAGNAEYGVTKIHTVGKGYVHCVFTGILNRGEHAIIGCCSTDRGFCIGSRIVAESERYVISSGVESNRSTVEVRYVLGNDLCSAVCFNNDRTIYNCDGTVGCYVIPVIFVADSATSEYAEYGERNNEENYKNYSHKTLKGFHLSSSCFENLVFGKTISIRIFRDFTLKIANYSCN